MIRRAEPRDRGAIAHICMRTGAQGDDATDLYGDDLALADVYALPYLDGPHCFCLVLESEGTVCGYVLGTEDTVAFQEWFDTVWWPEAAVRHDVRTPDDARLLEAAADPGRMLSPHLESYPAHLHIDLLPECQGRGAGRALIEAACELLAERGVHGVHLVAERANLGAQAFYPRVGFEAVGGDDATVTFARTLGPHPVAE